MGLTSLHHWPGTLSSNYTWLKQGGNFCPNLSLRVELGKLTEVVNLTTKGVIAPVVGLAFHNGVQGFLIKNPLVNFTRLSRITGMESPNLVVFMGILG